MWDQASVPCVQHSVSRKELLSQLRSGLEVIETEELQSGSSQVADSQGLGAFFAHLQKPCSSPIFCSSLANWSLRM